MSSNRERNRSGHSLLGVDKNVGAAVTIPGGYEVRAVRVQQGEDIGDVAAVHRKVVRSRDIPCCRAGVEMHSGEIDHIVLGECDDRVVEGVSVKGGVLDPESRV